MKSKLKKDNGIFGIREEYNTVEIGGQEWMTDNLCVGTYRNGDPIPYARTEDEATRYGQLKEGCYCYFEFNEENHELGKLYNWYAVNDKRGLAPEGYRISSNDDWNELFDNLGGLEKEGTIINYLRYGSGFSLEYSDIKSTDGWEVCNEFWTSDNMDDGGANTGATKVSISSEDISCLANDEILFNKSEMNSVRCIRGDVRGDVEIIDEFLQEDMDKDSEKKDSFDDFM